MTFRYARPSCPKCDMAMIVTAGFQLDNDHQTFECLRCGHTQAPQPLKQLQRLPG
jgi:Zn ribbon nucleic-acid-binding protein